MKIIYQVTDEDILTNIEDALQEIEDDNPVMYPDESTRKEVIEVCLEYICDAYDRNAYYNDGYIPGYYSIVYDTLMDYDCIESA